MSHNIDNKKLSRVIIQIGVDSFWKCFVNKKKKQNSETIKTEKTI